MQHERRVFTSCAGCECGSHIELSREDTRHLCKVLRLGNGDEVIIIDRDTSVEFLGRIVESSPVATVELLSTRSSKSNQCPIELIAVALCKGNTNDSICERATEIGVKHIVFWNADRSIPKVSTDEARTKRLVRWQKIAESACKQSSRNDLPSLSYAQSLTEALTLSMQYSSQLFCCSLLPEAQPISKLNLSTQKAHLLIGPEGDFSQAEEETISKINTVQLLSLGNFRLRVETATLLALGILSSALPTQE
jgi:16S rRNA (uracil1498-N3)-methyltransferase